VQTLSTLGKAQLPAQIARWLDGLDETGRWALLKLVTGALRIGVSARLAKTAVAALGSRQSDEIEVLWPGLTPPYLDLFAWLEGRAEKPSTRDPAPFRSRMQPRNPISPLSTRRIISPNGNGTASECRLPLDMTSMAIWLPGFIRARARKFPAAFPICSRRCGCPAQSMANC
jgi:ATP-dependent DNA ligase